MHIFTEKESLDKTLDIDIDLENKVFELFIGERKEHVLVVLSQVFEVRVLGLDRDRGVHGLFGEEVLPHHVELRTRSDVCVSLTRVRPIGESVVFELLRRFLGGMITAVL
jgi:hypothetical protein